MIVVLSFVMTIRLAEPKSSKVAFSRFKPTSSAITFALVKIPMSFSISLRRSPKPGAFTAQTLTIPRMVLTTKVAKASPSTSSAIINNERPSLATLSSTGNSSRILEIFLSTNKI